MSPASYRAAPRRVACAILRAAGELRYPDPPLKRRQLYPLSYGGVDPHRYRPSSSRIFAPGFSSNVEFLIEPSANQATTRAARATPITIHKPHMCPPRIEPHPGVEPGPPRLEGGAVHPAREAWCPVRDLNPRSQRFRGAGSAP